MVPSVPGRCHVSEPSDLGLGSLLILFLVVFNPQTLSQAGVFVQSGRGIRTWSVIT